MIAFSGRIVVALEPVDLRRGHDGLATLVRELWDSDPYDGTLFVFLGRRRDRIKVLFFHAGGFVLVYKRLERGRFTLPKAAKDASCMHLESQELAMLLDGIDLRSVTRLRSWKKNA